MHVSQYLSKIKGSDTALIFAKAKELESLGNDIIHFEIGQPDFSPPQKVLEATITAIEEKKTEYTVSRGLVSLRKKIAEHHNREDNIDLNYKSDIIVTAGAKLSIFGCLWSVLNSGDNAIILNPSWVSYADMVTSFGAEPRFLPVDLDFSFSEDALMQLIDEKTKACIVNSPSNPTGSVISAASLSRLYEICRQHDILLISDEIYREYIYEGSFTSLAHIPDWQESGAIIQGFSKTFSMTGFRMGYTLAQPQLIDQINKIQQLTTTCPVNFAQCGALVALDHFGEMRNFIGQVMTKRRDLITKLLSELPVVYQPPKGAFYAWVKLPGVTNSVKWAADLLDQQGVALTPGRAFGPAGEGHIRISFATTEDILREGISRIAKFL